MGRTSATACYRELGEELRTRRKAAGYSAGELAKRTGWHISKISRIESGQADINEFDVLHYLGFCGIYLPKARDLLALCRHAERRIGYWLSPHGEWLEDSLSSLIYHETAADSSTTYEPQLVPGLLQTADYARARIEAGRLSPEEQERGVRLRLARQRILHVRHPARFVFFIGEQALRLQVGSAAIMQEQLLKLVLSAALDHVIVRVVPSAAEESWAFGGSFRLLQYSKHRPLVYLDNHATGLFLEDREYVERYRMLVPAIAKVALDGTQSRELIATLATGYDRGSGRDASYGLEEEQRQ